MIIWDDSLTFDEYFILSKVFKNVKKLEIKGIKNYDAQNSSPKIILLNLRSIVADDYEDIAKLFDKS